ncbi:MAG: DUF4097 family beta strand repeat-containing protein [Anaerolineales bacterium]
MKRTIILLIAWTVLLASCQSPAENEPIHFETIPASELTAVRIRLDAGELSVEGSTADQIQFSSSTDCQVSREQKILVLDCQKSERSAIISLDLPSALSLEIESYNAQVILKNTINSIQVKNTAGSTFLENFQGEAALRAGQGDITASGGEGSLEIFSEHGSLKVSGFSGPTSMATIMGEILYQGEPALSFPINLEADHGSITALIPTSSSYQITANTAAGEAVCLGGDFRQTNSGCQGTTGAGDEIINIRTVSGRIEVRILP